MATHALFPVPEGREPGQHDYVAAVVMQFDAVTFLIGEDEVLGDIADAVAVALQVVAYAWLNDEITVGVGLAVAAVAAPGRCAPGNDEGK